MIHLVLNRRRKKASRDPTQLTLLRKSFTSDVNARVRALRTNLITSPTAIRRTVGDIESYWGRYTQQAVRRGIEHSWSDANTNIPKDEFDILRRDFMRQLEGDLQIQTTVASQRIHSELQGVSQGIITRVERARADGRDRRLSRSEIEINIRKAIDWGKHAANRVAQTELTRAYANGQLMALEHIGIEYVDVDAEWITSGLGETALGNPSPCPKCAPFEGRVFNLSKAFGLIPFHPFCMCRWQPVFETEFDK